jgi:thiosulfate/3-mercaptopyruvate sulfurtransferase
MSLPLTHLALLLFPAAADATPAAYARPDLLVEAADLAKAKGLRVLDARGKGNYEGGHVPGAVWVDQVTWAQAFKGGRDRDAWARRIGALGIGPDTRVVVYDDSRSKDAARIWWILRYWGVRDVRLLNGGWRAWQAAGGPAEKGENRPRAVAVRLEPQVARLATKKQIMEALPGKPQILDARSADEFCGNADTANRNGAIPGAVHLEWSDTLDPKTGRFKSAGELTKLFKEAGVDPSRPATTYCQSGGRAAVLAFVVELMGGKEVRNYYRSWSEWGNAEDTPVVKPKPKK